MIFQTLIKKLSRYSRHWLATESYTAQDPLVDATGLSELALYAQSLPSSLLELQRYATHPHIGETPSFYRGRGFEFEENRAYQLGDEQRLLNWRLFARTGDLYTKVFTEDRRPQVFLLVDRRAAMRFATRRQLKATLAAKIGACYAYHAQRQTLAVGGLILNQTTDWFSPATGEVPLQSFVQSLVAPCPPLDFEQNQLDFSQSLQLLLHRLPAGCFMFLVSDFSDLDPDSATPLLLQLVAQHTVQAIQILDPVEQCLPADGDFLIEDATSPQPLRIDGRNELQQTRYAHAFNDRQSKLSACFKSCNIPLKICSTQDDIEICMGQHDAAHNKY